MKIVVSRHHFGTIVIKYICFLVATDACAFEYAIYVLVYMFIGESEVMMLFLQAFLYLNKYRNAFVANFYTLWKQRDSSAIIVGAAKFF